MLVRSTAYHLCTRLILVLGLSATMQTLQAMTFDNRNDPAPIYKTLDPQTFLLTREKLILKGYAVDTPRPERISLSLSPFGQRSVIAKDKCKNDINLGNIDGRWAMVGLLMGDVPEGYQLPPTLQVARQNLFPNQPPGTPINDPTAVDKNQLCGFFTIPANYRKYGMRFNFEAQLIGDVGVSIDVGLANISLTPCPFINLTTSDVDGNVIYGLCDTTSCDCFNPSLTKKNINEYLMCPYKEIMQEICYDINDFNKFSVEDIRMFLYWRHAYPINSYKDEWEDFLLTPFFKVGGAVSASKQYNPNQLFGLSFGNQNHDAVGFTAGLNCDFANTIEIGGETGITHFFGRQFSNYHVPTSQYQVGIYPFATCVNINPGANWHFTAKMNAYHFMGNLSFFFQYVLVIHTDDSIRLNQPNPGNAFKPELLEEKSNFRVQVGNIGFNYDIAPQISLGFLWQAPLSQYNAYRSTTIMVGFNAMF